MRKLFILLLTISGLLAHSCGNVDQESSLMTEEVIPVKLLSLKEDTSRMAIRVSGFYTTDDETVLSFKNGGVINRIYVKEGDKVKKGQVLATLNLTEIEAGVNQANLSYEKAKRDYQRARQLFLDSVATREQMENAQTAQDVAFQQVKAARFNQHYAEIRASLDGFILQRFVNEGQVVGPGIPIFRLNGASSADWLVKVGVSDKQWGLIEVGDDARVNSDLTNGDTLYAHVYKKSEGIDPTSGMFIVFLRIDDQEDLRAASGVLASVEIIPSKQHVGWRIPYDALLDGEGGKGYVFITNDRKVAKKVQVQIAAIHRDEVLIESGLQTAGYLIISGSAYLHDGSSIRETE